MEIEQTPSMDKKTSRMVRKLMSHTAESECRRLLEERGWRVHYAGFLDYICEKGNNLIIVEVKSHQCVNERHDQHLLMVKIVNYGIPCFVYRPDTGFLSVPGNARSDDLGSDIQGKSLTGASLKTYPG